MLDFVIVFVTVSSNEEGEKIARQLIELKAAPCVNISEKYRSYLKGFFAGIE